MLHLDESKFGNSLDLSELFDAATFRAAAARLVYVCSLSVLLSNVFQIL